MLMSKESFSHPFWKFGVVFAVAVFIIFRIPRQSAAMTRFMSYGGGDTYSKRGGGV